MERTSIKELVKWKDSSRRKPLVIEGARQVGKTWLEKSLHVKTTSSWLMSTLKT